MAAIPTTHNKLNILDPTTFAIAISLLPFKAAVTLTAASGALVPNATIVKPIIKVGTLKILAIDEEPTTNVSAPFIRSKKPIINNI
jgi:hypothetical protein